jgi:hypothetical protein
MQVVFYKAHTHGCTYSDYPWQFDLSAKPTSFLFITQGETYTLTEV